MEYARDRRLPTSRLVRFSLLACFLLGTVAVVRAAQPGTVPVAGWLERARLSPGEIVLEAKLDTGARTSSIHALNLQQFERAGKNWVAFDVVGADGRSVRLERPLVRIAKIKSAPGTEEERPTVTLGICIGNVFQITEVSLVDRSGLSKPLLIGRRFLKGRLVVDLSHRYLLEPLCNRKSMP